MAGNTKEGDDVFETIQDFIERRRREVADLGRKAEAMAQAYYGAAQRAGSQALIQRQAEVNALGKLVQGPQSQDTKAAPAAAVPARPAQTQVSAAQTRAGQPAGGIVPLAVLPKSVDELIGKPRPSIVDQLNLEPSPGRTVSIEGRLYEQVDNGRANVLVPFGAYPAAAPLNVDQSGAVQRVDLMLSSPIGGAAYGISTLFGAPQEVSDAALMAGATADVALRFAPSAGVSRSPPILLEREAGALVIQQPRIFNPELNSSGQSGVGRATVIEGMLGTGTRATGRLKPAGWIGNGKKTSNNYINSSRLESLEARGHIIANLLGGSGKDIRNLMTLTQNPTNHPQMSAFEAMVAKRARNGEVVDYQVTPLYSEDFLPPSGVLMVAVGSGGSRAARVIQNPAGKPK